MRVNRVDGLHFQIDNLQDIESLTRQVIALGLPGSDIEVQSKRYVEYVLRDIFNKTGKYKYKEGAIDTSGIDITTTESYTKVVGNIKSEETTEAIMDFISKLQVPATKKTLVIYFMTRGVHIYCRDYFKLITDPAYFEGTGMDKNLIAQIIEYNKEINASIQEFYNMNDKDIDLSWKVFYDNCSNYLTQDGYDLLKQLSSQVLWDDISNIKARFINGSTGVNYFVNDSFIPEFNQQLIRLREKHARIDHPTIDSLLLLFNLSKSSYDRHKNNGLNTLIRTSGLNLDKDATE